MEKNNVSLIRELDNYKMIDIMKYIAAIMVICIHCKPIVSQKYLDYFLKQIVCRIAVPFFFISSAYFVRKSCHKNPNYLNQYLKKLTKSYLIWSVIFVRIGLDWIYQNLTLSKSLLPLALIFGLIHVGTYYHLWYIPASIISLYLIDKLIKRVPYKIIFLISIPLFLFGSLETYYGLLPVGGVKSFFDTVIQIFFTTRSGLLFGMVFTATGFFIYDYQEKLKASIKYIPALTLLFSILLIAEGIFLYSIPKLDMNFLLMLVPFSFFFFLWMLSFPKTIQFETKKIRLLSKYYYFVHVICIVIVEEIGTAFGINILSSGIISFSLILLLTHILCLAVIKIQKQKITVLRIVFAALLGIVPTLIIASIVHSSKNFSYIVKFELVPCLWAYASIVIYYLLGKMKLLLNKTYKSNFYLTAKQKIFCIKKSPRE